jgi:DNA ligase-1
MRTLGTIQQFVDYMNQSNKRKAKRECLRYYSKNKDVKQLLKVIYNPMYTFGVTSTQIKKAKPTCIVNEDFELLFLLRRLINRELSGNEALGMCASVIAAEPQSAELLYKIFDKDLKIGVDTKTINDEMGLNIPMFQVALAFDLNKSEAGQKRLEKEPYLITRKLDGVRLICKYSYKDNSIRFFSRVGHEFTTLNVLKDALLPVLTALATDCILDGELCVIDNDKEDFKAAVSQIKRKDYTMQAPHYKIFDILSPDEFEGKDCKRPYSMRLICARTAFANRSKYYSVLKACRYTPENFAKATQAVEANGWEGLILRADAPYQFGRTADLLKVKKFTDAEFVIEDITTTEKGVLDVKTNQMVRTKMAGAVIVRYKGNPVAVGSGLSDPLRIDLYNHPDKYLGRTITVKFFEETKDSLGNPSLRFPIFKGFRDGEKI